MATQINNNTMKITVLDKISFTNGDLNLNCFNLFGKVEYYDILPKNEVASVLKNTDIVVCNKTVFDKELIDKCPSLKFIGLTATGFNNVDTAYAKEKGIVVCNVPNYSTRDVAQHVFAFILNYTNKVSEYDLTVKQGKWQQSKTFCYFNIPLTELAGKTLGVIGYGNIGKEVSKIATAFNMNVLVYNRTKKEMPYSQVDLETLFKESDFITIHCALNEDTKNLINEKSLSLMKKSAVLINTARGGVIDEVALKNALVSGQIAHACLDVLQVEPMQKDCVLFGLNNVTFTPHIAWAPTECRQRVVELVAKNIEAFLNGKPINVVN